MICFVGADDSVRPAEGSAFTKICGELETSQGPMRSPAGQVSEAHPRIARLLAPEMGISPYKHDQKRGEDKHKYPACAGMHRRDLIYLAYSTALVSRMTLTLIWPGYSSSDSIFLAISRASRIMLSSVTSSGLTMMRTSRPAWMA